MIAGRNPSLPDALPSVPDAVQAPPPAATSPPLPGQAARPGWAAIFFNGRLLGWGIALLTLAVFVTDCLTGEDLHVGILFNVCIALTLWSWRPRWVVRLTLATIVLRLIAHHADPGVHHDINPFVDMFNLGTGLTVQVLTGALIWRHVHVQQDLEARQHEVQHQAVVLASALEDARRATREAQEAAAREHLAAEGERAARLKEVETRRRERLLFRDLERVKGLSVALHRAVLPDVPASVAGGRLLLSARYAPAEKQMEIGGDFYDLFALDSEGMRWGLVIGDVAGHGVDAAAQTSLVTTTLRTCVFESKEGPAQILARTARALEGQLTSFVSAVYAVYDVNTCLLTWANAGHEPPILVRGDGQGAPLPLSPTGSLLGIGLDDFTQQEMLLEPGHILVMITDGLVEARTDSNAMLGWDGLAAIAARHTRASDNTDSIADGILEDARAFVGSRRINDDIALLVARIAAG